MKKEELIRLFSGRVRRILEEMDLDFSDIHEIRLRAGAPLQMICRGREFFPDEGGRASRAGGGVYMTERDLRETMEYIGNYSLYAYEDEIRQGYLTIQGGHRVGIAGKTVMEDGKIKGISHISCINLRIAHSVEGCADPVMPYLWEKGEFCHTLIVSAPRCGKTTLLRDVIRQISDGDSRHKGLTVGVVDERSEIAGACRGVAQNRLGIRTDVLDGCPKAEGMMMLIRSMSPDVVAVDEIGTAEDLHALESVLNCGCRARYTEIPWRMCARNRCWAIWWSAMCFSGISCCPAKRRRELSRLSLTAAAPDCIRRGWGRAAHRCAVYPSVRVGGTWLSDGTETVETPGTAEGAEADDAFPPGGDFLCQVSPAGGLLECGGPAAGALPGIPAGGFRGSLQV